MPAPGGVPDLDASKIVSGILPTARGGTGGTGGGGPAQAARSAIEGETNEDTYIPPDLIRHSPGVGKVWVKWEQTGAHGITVSHNMTSVTDGGAAGDTDHLWADDLSGSEFVMYSSAGSNRSVDLSDGTSLAGGVTTLTVVTSSASQTDHGENMMAISGDH